MTLKLALFIDAENVSYKELPSILEEILLYGHVVIRAAYGDWEGSNLQNWREVAEANQFSIRHQANAKIKNASDIKLIVEAMELLLLYPTEVDVFCLVSNDAHYVPLCDKIHEYKKSVIGIGYQQASDAFIRACNKFIFIGRGETPAQSLVPTSLEIAPTPVEPPKSTKVVASPKPVASPQAPVTVKPPNQAAIRKLLTEAMAKSQPDANGWVLLTTLGHVMGQIQPGFRTGNYYGHAKLTKFLESMPDFIQLTGSGSEAAARLIK